MISSLFNCLVSGQISLWRALCGRPAGDAHLRSPASLWTMLAILIAIGLTRDALSVLLGITGPRNKWYSFDPDIVVVMMFWPAHLLFFGTFLIHGGLRLAKVRGVDRRKLLAFFFHLQALHLVVPILDRLGFFLGLPHHFYLWEGRVMTPYYTNVVAMSLGIIAVWLMTFYATFVVVIVRLRLPLLRAVLVLAVVWLLIVAWTYIFFPTFNTVFSALFGFVRTRQQFHWGYATFFMLTTILGMFYFRKRALDEG